MSTHTEAAELSPYEMVLIVQLVEFYSFFVQGQEVLVIHSSNHTVQDLYSGISPGRHCRITKANVIRARVETAEAIISNTGQKSSQDDPRIKNKAKNISSVLTVFFLDSRLTHTASYERK